MLSEAAEGTNRVLNRHEVYGIFTLRQYALIRSLMAEAYLEGRLDNCQQTLQQIDLTVGINAERTS